MSKTAHKSASIEVNTGQFSDWPALLHLIQTSFKAMEGRISPPSSMHKLTLENLAQKAKDETLLYAYDGKQLIGCAFACDRGDCLYVGKVSVTPNRQGCGVGQALIEACKSLARQLGQPEIEVQTRVELTENHRFFEKSGFYKTGEDAHEGFDRPTSITLRCKVKRP